MEHYKVRTARRLGRKAASSLTDRFNHTRSCSTGSETNPARTLSKIGPRIGQRGNAGKSRTTNALVHMRIMIYCESPGYLECSARSQRRGQRQLRQDEGGGN